MNNLENNQQSEAIKKALESGVNLLNSDIKVAVSELENLVNLKLLLKNFLSGEFVIVDKEKFEELNSNKEEN